LTNNLQKRGNGVRYDESYYYSLMWSCDKGLQLVQKSGALNSIMTVYFMFVHWRC